MVEMIGAPATLEQLAEESAELAQAALKLARRLRGENPTPRAQEECVESLEEEMADVLVLMDQVCGMVDMNRVKRIMRQKTDRWYHRMEEWRDRKCGK